MSMILYRETIVLFSLDPRRARGKKNMQIVVKRIEWEIGAEIENFFLPSAIVPRSFAARLSRVLSINTVTQKKIKTILTLISVQLKQYFLKVKL